VNARFEVYPRQDNDIPPGLVGEGFGWRFRAGTGRITATSIEGYASEEDAERAVRQFCDDLEPYIGANGDLVLPPDLLRVDS